MKERYNIKIMDIQLTILSDEPEDFVHTVVAQLDERVRDLTMQNRRCSKLDAALLCALDSLAEKLKDEKKIRNLEHQIELYEATNKRLREELEAVRASAAGSAASEEAIPAAPLEEETAPAEPAAVVPETPAADNLPEEAPADTTSGEPAAEPASETVGEAPEKVSAAEPSPAEESSALHDAKLRQIEDLLRRRSEENAARPAESAETPKAPSEAARPASVSRDDKLRQIEDLLRRNGGNKSLSEALHDAIGN